jgi:OOP family OmpA-OmpF porin
MKNQLIAVTTLVFLAGASSTVLAQAKRQQDAGWYAGLSGGRADTGFTNQDFVPTVAGAALSTSTDTQGIAYRILLGYNFDRNWALEGAYTDIGDAKYNYAGTIAAVPGSGEAKVSNSAWSLSVKGAIPIGQQFDLFGRLGWSHNRSSMSLSSSWPAFQQSASHNRSDALVGLGLEYKPTANVGIRAEYDNHGRFGNRWNTTSDTGRTRSEVWLLGATVRFQ